MQIDTFTGRHLQKIDGKGRTTIPSDFRAVLDQGDPDRKEGANPRMQLLFGDHLGQRLEVWTMAAFRVVESDIVKIRPRTDEEAAAKDWAENCYLACSCRLEVDRDGRTVIPLDHRARLGRPDGEVVFAGKSNRFEIWAADTYEAEVAGPMRARFAAMPRGSDPMTAIYAMTPP